MRKVNQKAIGPDIYALIERAQLGELNRQKALDAMGRAEVFAAAALWVREKVTALGTWFLKLSVKH